MGPANVATVKPLTKLLPNTVTVAPVGAWAGLMFVIVGAGGGVDVPCVFDAPRPCGASGCGAATVSADTGAEVPKSGFRTVTVRGPSGAVLATSASTETVVGDWYTRLFGSTVISVPPNWTTKS